MSENVFEVENLGLYYLGRFGDKTHAVTDVSFSMKKGEILGIAGESGCGKSTLVSGLMGMCIPPLYPEKGDVRVRVGDHMESLMHRKIEDVRANVLAQQVSMIPQGAFNALNPVRKIKDIAADVIAAHQQPGKKLDHKEIYDRLCERFDLFGMDTKRVLNSYPIQLTAGPDSADRRRTPAFRDRYFYASQPADGDCRRTDFRSGRFDPEGSDQDDLRPS